jgi:hypothetical protein
LTARRGLGAAERGGIGQQSRPVPGVDQATAERGERARIALGSICRDDKLHEPLVDARGLPLLQALPASW